MKKGLIQLCDCKSIYSLQLRCRKAVVERDMAFVQYIGVSAFQVWLKNIYVPLAYVFWILKKLVQLFVEKSCKLALSTSENNIETTAYRL